MKRILALALSVVLMVGVFSGCSNKVNDKDRKVEIAALGLEYLVPATWLETEGVNVMPVTIQNENTFAEVVYGYITPEGMEMLNTQTGISTTDVLNVVCEILIGETTVIDNGGVDNIISLYENSQKVGEQGKYSYYLLWAPADTTNSFTADELAIYNKLVEAVPEMIDTIKTKEFDDSTIIQNEERLKKTLTFQTKALEGASIDSTIFADYDITVFNFCGTYIFEDFNEYAVLEEVYSVAKKFPTDKVNLINAVIDTPDEAAEKIALEAKKEAGATFLTIMLDKTLANWVTTNLTGVPSTVFVDKDGMIVGEVLEGAHTADEYLQALSQAIETVRERNNK